MIAVVLATGPSMSQAVADSVRCKALVIAVSNAYKLAPWADACVSTDGKWWRHNPDALKFEGRRIGVIADFQKIEGVESFKAATGANSGLLGIQVAVSMGADTVLLAGFDMKGAHFFGKHPEPLKNTTPQRYEVFKRQFANYKPRGVRIVNCTPGSQLKCYPTGDLLACLAESSLHAA